MARGLERARRWAAVVIASGLLLLAVSEARAERSYKVVVETEPAGATVYVGQVDAGAAGTTPLELELPAGEHVLIIELARHAEAFESITVRKRRRGAQTFRFELEPLELYDVVVEAATPAAEGGSIIIDGRVMGTVPTTVSVEPGPHQLVVKKDGFRLFERWVEVTGPDTEPVRVTLESLAPRREERVVKKAPEPEPEPAPEAHVPMFDVAAGVVVAGRVFDYRNARTTNLRRFDTDPVGLARVTADLYPWRRAGVLPGLTLALSFAHSPAIVAATDSGMEISALWRDIDIGLRYGIDVAGAFRIELEGGLHDTAFTFDRDAALADEVPDVEYRAGRVLIRAGKQLGRAYVYGGFQSLVVLSAGRLEERFASTAVNGFSGQLGGNFDVIESVQVRAALDYTRYQLEFESTEGGAFQADGAVDQFFGLSITAAYIF